MILEFEIKNVQIVEINFVLVVLSQHTVLVLVTKRRNGWKIIRFLILTMLGRSSTQSNVQTVKLLFKKKKERDVFILHASYQQDVITNFVGYVLNLGNSIFFESVWILEKKKKNKK